METVKNINVVWRFHAFDLISFNAEERAPNAEKIDLNKINFQLSVDSQINQAEKKVILISSVEIFSNEAHTELLGTIRTKGEVVIENFNEVVVDKTRLPIQLMASLMGIQISTTRGMLKLLSKGTVFEQAIIPIVNPMAFFPPGSIRLEK
ncbi:hypothetical protein SanaruYs_19780 [Chryseotalea sanaruensis]|uniref:Uncharacterized protein n=1 Tax=Chryseotalea sanaruensis TaxID=2482724 RepID=A0A401UA30_9BACT|nr:hypothetical protein [Chryseotalea sanaruensis]GCC51749.1 hypothetical protein SanaruYs_19780 [Chryseotalea sanaruensis]